MSRQMPAVLPMPAGIATSSPGYQGLYCEHGAVFKTPQIILFCRDVDTAATFYRGMGFEEVFRTPAEGAPIHVDLVLDGYRVGLASEASTRDDHGLAPVVSGQRAAVILWTDDTPRGYARLQELGAKPVKDPEPWLGRLLIAWAEDPDGHLIQVVQSIEE
ncbi:MAG: VOC family protein [Nocardioides sp.]